MGYSDWDDETLDRRTRQPRTRRADGYGERGAPSGRPSTRAPRDGRSDPRDERERASRVDRNADDEWDRPSPPPRSSSGSRSGDRPADRSSGRLDGRADRSRS
ncbi:MAG TPA: hypothetical protein VKQ36_00865, partial [Ktedonobacterales bacterium]|nr:hypothetical protein [Ktedonobacterales bacterium]